MAEEKLLTVRDVSAILGLSEKEVLDLTGKGSIPAYKIGGVYLRFKRSQIEEFKKTSKPSQPRHKASSPYPLFDKLNDFFYFNDFYILAILIIALILLVIFQAY